MNNSTLSAALDYAARGWPVIPCHTSINGKCSCGKINCDSPGKHPRTEHGLKEASTDPAIIRGWWGRWPDANVSVLCGKESNLLDLDFDVKKGNKGIETYQKLQKEHGEINTLMQQTPSGGWHCFFNHPGVKIKNHTAILPGLDIRSDDGYAVVPPSMIDGNAYQWVNAAEPAVLPEGIKKILLNGGGKRDRKKRGNGKGSHDVSILDGVPEGQRDDALFRYACSLKGQHRPREEAEVLVRAAAANCIPPFDQEAAREKVERVYEQYTDQEGDVPDWEEPVPIDVYALPPLPERVLPEPFDGYAKALSASTETPLELALMDILSVTAAALQGRYTIEVKPGYLEPVNIWTMPIQPPGTRKTQVKREAMEPLTAWEREQKIELREAIQERDSERKTLLKRIERKRTEAAKAEDEDYKTLSDEVSKLEKELPEPLRPPRLWTEDVTPETLGVLMAQNRECMAILSAEGGIFGIMAGRYNKGQPNLDIFLKGHAGEPVRVDRGSREPVYLENPRLTVGLSVQPEILHGLSATRDFRGRGLLARFLYVYPGNNLGRRGLDTVELSGAKRLSYSGRILALLNKPWNTDQHGRECPYILRFSPGAYAVWAEFWHHIEGMLGDGCRLSHIRDWGSKLPGAIARVAALFHCIRHATVEPSDQPIGKEDAVLAVDLGRILIEHALKVFDCMALDENHEGARVVVKWIRKNRLAEFSVRDCAKNHRSRFKTVEELYPALKILEDAGWIRQKDPGKGRGRPIRAYLVNPEAIKNEHV